MEARTGAIVKTPEFCNVQGARSKNSIFRVLGYPSTILRTLTAYTGKPQTNGTDVRSPCTDSKIVPFASLESLVTWMLSTWSRDHHENVENSLIPKMLFFSIYDEK